MNRLELLSKFSLASDVSFSSALQYNFIIGYPGQTITTNYRVEERTSSYEIVRKLVSNFFPKSNTVIMGGSSISLVVYVEEFNDLIGYFIVTDVSSDIDSGKVPENALLVKQGKFEITFVMDLSIFKNRISDKFNDLFPSLKAARVNWSYTKDGRTMVQEISIEDENVIHDEFYPFIKGGVKKLVTDYINSNESVLLLLGPPGTGKTSLLRHMICSNNFHACMTYDENIFTSDKFYLDYLLGSQNDLMIVEDADVLLEDRSRAGNKMMSKLLNFGDGLVKMPNKKMIFTTNITDMTKFDEALTRPGRCFGIVEFRLLSQKQANVAAEIAGLTHPEGKDEYSLADIFSRKETKKVRRFGFV